MIRLLVLLISFTGLVAPSVSSGVTIRELFRDLASDDYAARFSAALILIDSRHPQIAPLLSEALRREPFQSSKAATAAAEFVLLKLSGQTASEAPPSRQMGPNVVLISVDTVRADHLGCYGYERDTTPAMDALARSGALFVNAISPSPWTLPTHMSMLTSLYPSFHKLERGGSLGSIRLDESEQTLAEVLNAAGYTTAGFVAHPFLSGEWGFNRGFDLYGRYSTRAGAQTFRVLLWLEWHQFHVSRGLGDSSFFLFLHYIDPHEPYSAPSPYREKYFPDYQGPLRPPDKLVTMFSQKDFDTPADFRYALALYDGELNFVDANLGKIFEKIRELGWEESTMVILTSDHGEEFKDHGSMGHAQTVYDELLRVPLIIRYPQLIDPGQRVAAQVSLLDIAPTVLDFLSHTPLPKAQGRSLASYLGKGSGESRERSVPRDVFAELGPLGFAWEGKNYGKAIRTDEFKLIYNYQEDGAVTKELYELRTDPNERVNVYEPRKDEKEIRELEERLAAFVREGLEYNGGFRTKNEFEIDEETQEHLRALGYIE